MSGTKDRGTKTAGSRPTKLGPIHADEALPLRTFMARTGLKDWAIRSLRRRGLKVRRVGENGGGAGFVLGEDWIAFLREHTDP